VGARKKILRVLDPTEAAVAIHQGQGLEVKGAERFLKSGSSLRTKETGGGGITTTKRGTRRRRGIEGRWNGHLKEVF